MRLRYFIRDVKNTVRPATKRWENSRNTGPQLRICKKGTCSGGRLLKSPSLCIALFNLNMRHHAQVIEQGGSGKDTPTCLGTATSSIGALT
jgi:hypothetical protein